MSGRIRMRALLLEIISLPVVLINYALYLLENLFREDLFTQVRGPE